MEKEKEEEIRDKLSELVKTKNGFLAFILWAIAIVTLLNKMYGAVMLLGYGFILIVKAKKELKKNGKV